MISQALINLHNINLNDEYGIPVKMFEEACLKYNVNPVIDYAASDKLHVLEKYVTKDQDALSMNWLEDGFLNPPYSEIKKFLQHAYIMNLKNNINLLVLCYAKTDTRFFHDYVLDKAEIHFIKGRVKFLDFNGNVPTYCKNCKKRFSGLQFCPLCNSKTFQNSSPYPSCWVIYRSKNAT